MLVQLSTLLFISIDISIDRLVRNHSLARYNTNGTLDTAFNSTGKVVTPIGTDDDIGRSVAIQTDGKIVAAGQSYNGTDNDFALARYNTNGTLDNTFNGTGKAVTPIGSGTDVAQSIAIQTDGKIVAAGYSSNGSNYDFALVRYFGTACAAASISGTVTYGNAAAPPKYISNATVTGAGSPTVMTTTAAPGGTAGQYILTGFGAGSYTVSLSKTTGQNSITSNDAARIAQHVASILSLTTDNQKVAADVSGNGVISSNDAALIARYVASLGAPIGSTGQWRFYIPPGPTFPVGSSPTSRTYPSVTSNLTGEDYVGLLIGEVTGNWVPSAARPAGSGVSSPSVGSPHVSKGSTGQRGALTYVRATDTGPERGIAVEMPNLVTPLDKEIVVPVSVPGIANKDVISYEFDLRYDPSVIQPSADVVDIAGTASRGLSFVVNTIEPGLLRVVMYGAYPVDGNGVLLNLRFMAVGKAGSVSPLMFERIVFNEGLQMTATGGKIELY